MKTLTLVNGSWLEFARSSANSRSREMSNASPADAAAAQHVYDANKPKDGEVISVNVTLPTGRGIINYRVNNEHLQIRF